MKVMSAVEMQNVNAGATKTCNKCGTKFTDNFWQRLFGNGAQAQLNNHKKYSCNSISVYNKAKRIYGW